MSRKRKVKNISKKCARGSFRTIRRGKKRIVICCPKGKFKDGRCTVGTKAQSTFGFSPEKHAREAQSWARLIKRQSKQTIDAAANGNCGEALESLLQTVGAQAAIYENLLDRPKEADSLTGDDLQRAKHVFKESCRLVPRWVKR